MPQFRPGLWLLSASFVASGLIFSSGSALREVKSLSALALAQTPPVSTSDAPIIILGQPCNQPYIVVIPTRDPDLLDQVQVYAPAAFLTESRLGPYIQADSAPTRGIAEAWSRRLRRQGFDARVVYRPVDCPSQ